MDRKLNEITTIFLAHSKYIRNIFETRIRNLKNTFLRAYFFLIWMKTKSIINYCAFILTLIAAINVLLATFVCTSEELLGCFLKQVGPPRVFEIAASSQVQAPKKRKRMRVTVDFSEEQEREKIEEIQ